MKWKSNRFLRKKTVFQWSNQSPKINVFYYTHLHTGIGFTPSEAGVYVVEVLKNGSPVSNSPFKINVTEDELADASKVKAYGEGLRQGRANEINRFSINSKNAGLILFLFCLY